MRRSLIVAAVMLVHVTGARGQSACDKPRNDFDGVYCLSKIYQQADQDLNDSYARLRQQLNPAEENELRSGRLAWLRNRDAECSRHEPEGFYVNLACATKVTIARNQFLENRYRECISSGCLGSRPDETGH
jgi:uncharacterized protein YecT (DUF1311 family)